MTKYLEIRKSLMQIEEDKRKEGFYIYLFGAILSVIMLIIMLLSTYVFVNIRVSGSSMNKTLYNNDIVIANKLKQAKKGDIVIISGISAYGEDWLIKRVIAMEGDTVMIKDGRVFVNDMDNPIDEPYAYGSTRPGNLIIFEGQPITLEENQIFYLGDNRNGSSDSRVFGLCTEDNIVGVVENWSLRIRGITNKLFVLFSPSTGN